MSVQQGDSLGDAARKIDGEKVAVAAAIGAVTNVVVPGTMIASGQTLTQAAVQAEQRAVEHVANVASTVLAENVPATASAAAVETLVQQASASIARSSAPVIQTVNGIEHAREPVTQIIEHLTESILHDEDDEVEH
jgi:hypothetical protein